MALFNESLAPRFNNLIRRLHSMKVGAPAPQITPEIGHVIIIANDRPENYLMQGERLWVFDVNVVANAGGLGQVELLNPTPGMIVVVQGIGIFNAAAGHAYTLNRDAAAAGTPVANNARDDRAVGQVSSQNRILNTAAGTSGVELDRTSANGNVDVFFTTVPYIVMPTHRLAVFDTTVNTALRVIMWGYERQLEESETNL